MLPSACYSARVDPLCQSPLLQATVPASITTLLASGTSFARYWSRIAKTLSSFRMILISMRLILRLALLCVVLGNRARLAVGQRAEILLVVPKLPAAHQVMHKLRLFAFSNAAALCADLHESNKVFTLLAKTHLIEKAI